MMFPERCYCAAPDCPSCGPMQGYRVPRRYPLGSLSAEDCDILNVEYYAELAAADADAEAAFERDDEAADTDIF